LSFRPDDDNLLAFEQPLRTSPALILLIPASKSLLLRGLFGGLCRGVTDIPIATGQMLGGFFNGQKEPLPKAGREEPQYRYFPNASGVVMRVPVQ